MLADTIYCVLLTLESDKIILRRWFTPQTKQKKKKGNKEMNTNTVTEWNALHARNGLFSVLWKVLYTRSCLFSVLQKSSAYKKCLVYCILKSST